MGTIIPRKRKDGSVGYMAQVRVKQKGKVVHHETKTFDRKQAANAWISRRETELREPGALKRLHADDPTLTAAIDRYIDESKRQIGRTKEQVLRTIKRFDIADMRCSEITSADIVTFAKALPAGPSTVQNYLSHLAAIFAVARPAWGYPLNRQAIKDAFVVAKRLGVTAKGRQRDRRPTIEELNQLMDHFGVVKARRPDSAPMQKIVPFAIFSTRRQEEITTIKWEDYECARNGEPARVLVRDMKHPGDKAGNDVWVDLTTEAAAYIESMPRRGERIFPFSTDAIGAAFTRACNLLGINTADMPDEERLHFHDLRHEGVSRLFEMGRTIPQAATVSGHRSWQSLKRYSHIRKVGDKFENWKWKTT
jgi:integrase